MFLSYNVLYIYIFTFFYVLLLSRNKESDNLLAINSYQNNVCIGQLIITQTR